MTNSHLASTKPAPASARRALFGGPFWCRRTGIGFRLCLPRLDAGGTGRDSVTAAVRCGILYEANNPCYESMSWFSLWEQRPGSPRWPLSAAVGYARLLARWRGRAKGGSSNPTDHSGMATAPL